MTKPKINKEAANTVFGILEKMTKYEEVYNSQDKMIRTAFRGISECLTFGDPEKVEDFQIETPDKIILGDLCLRITTKKQQCFIHFTPTDNNTKDLWHFLEHIILEPEDPSVLHIEQEGPEAILYVKPKGDKIFFAVLEDGWYEFSLPINEKQHPIFNKVYNDFNSVKMNMECSKKDFITKMYTVLRNIKYPESDDEFYDWWKDEPKDSEIVKKYCEE